MKKTLTYCCRAGLLLLPLAGCIKDRSVYDFADLEEITVTGLDESYTRSSGIDRLTLSPEVSSTDPNAKLEHMWGIYDPDALVSSGMAGGMDTIAWTKDLDYPINRKAKRWTLVYRVTNTNTGYAKHVSITVDVTTPYTRGWYVAKAENGQTDLDLFLTPTTIVPAGPMVANVFSSVNGRKLDGKPLLLTFVNEYQSYAPETGKFADTRSLFITTDRDVSVVKIDDLEEINGYGTLYIGPAPVDKDPRFVFMGVGGSYYINNAGRVAGIDTHLGQGSNTGQFGLEYEVDPSRPAYRMSRYFLAGNITSPYMYDEISCSFFYLNASSAAYFSAPNDHPATDMPCQNTNKELLWMGLKHPIFNASMQGYALFRDKTDPSLKILSRVEHDYFSSTLKITNDTLSAAERIYQGEHFAAMDRNENLLYFSVGREIYTRNLSNRSEQLQFTVPTGEEVTFIRHRFLPVGGTTPFGPYAYNYVMIGTKSGNDYKVRMFEKTSGNLHASPTFTLEGKGEVGDVMYIAPNLSGGIFVNHYPGTF